MPIHQRAGFVTCPTNIGIWCPSSGFVFEMEQCLFYPPPTPLHVIHHLLGVHNHINMADPSVHDLLLYKD